MDVRVLENQAFGGTLASFGSGDPPGAGVLGSETLSNRTRRLSENSIGRGSSARRALAREVQAAAGKRSGMTDAQRASFTKRLRALQGFNEINREGDQDFN